jgi:capsid protein
LDRYCFSCGTVNASVAARCRQCANYLPTVQAPWQGPRRQVIDPNAEFAAKAQLLTSGALIAARWVFVGACIALGFKMCS